MINFSPFEQQYGLPSGYLGRTAQIESGGNPMARNPNSSAKGPFQFIDATARQYGLQDPFDVQAATDAAARLARDNAAILARATGRQPTAAELYLAHQQGGGGAAKLLANPNARAVDIVGRDAVRLNGGREDMTAGEFAGIWLNKFNRTQGQQGLLAPTEQVSTQGRTADRGEPMAEERGLLGGLLNPDRRDRLIMALEGMTLNPNQALIQASGEAIKGRAAGRQESQAANRTAAWLRSQGREDLAAAVESGAVSGRDAASAALQPAEARGQLVTADQLRAQFPGTNIEDGLYNLKPDGTANKVGGGGPQINLPGQIGSIPPGYAVQYDAQNRPIGMTPIPGSPAAIELEQQQQAATQQQAASERQQGIQESVVSRDVDALVRMIDDKGRFNLPEAGILGNMLGTLGINQEAVTFKNTLESVQATIAFDALQKMREASKTGGALGGVSERELDLLINSRGALKQSTDPEVLKRNLLDIKRIMTKIENDPIASRAYYGFAGQGSTQGAAPTSSGGFSVTGRID